MAQFSDAELYRSYKSAKNQKEMLQILADLNCIPVLDLQKKLLQYESFLHQKAKLEEVIRTRVRELLLVGDSPMNIACKLKKEKLYTEEFPLLVDSVARQIEMERRLEMARRERTNYTKEFKTTVKDGIKQGLSVLELAEKLNVAEADFISFKSLYQRTKAALKANGERLEFNHHPNSIRRRKTKERDTSETIEETSMEVRESTKAGGSVVSEKAEPESSGNKDPYLEALGGILEVKQREVKEVQESQAQVSATPDTDSSLEIHRLLESLVWHKAIWLSQIDYFQSELATLQKLIARCDERIAELRRYSDD